MEIFWSYGCKSILLEHCICQWGAANNRVLTKFLISRHTAHSFTEAMFFPKLKGRGPNTTTMDLGPGTHKLPQHSSTVQSSHFSARAEGASDLGFKTKDFQRPCNQRPCNPRPRTQRPATYWPGCRCVRWSSMWGNRSLQPQIVGQTRCPAPSCIRNWPAACVS